MRARRARAMVEKRQLEAAVSERRRRKQEREQERSSDVKCRYE